jgi:UDPglucose 6-dehydrogenase
MRIIVIGAGYVGLVAAACFASFGINVTCYDKDKRKIDILNKGDIHIYEPGLKELVEKCLSHGNINFVSDIASFEDYDGIIIAVGTPANEDGRANTSYIFAAAQEISDKSKTAKFVVIKSTVPIGTAKKLKNYFMEINPQLDFEVISNPEFLREGSAVKDFLEPDRIILGCASVKAQEFGNKLYSPLSAMGRPVVFTKNETAELIKYAANSYLAMRIAFINEIANLAEVVNADIEEVANGMGLDARIGRHYLQAGPGYGGSCFPKDTSALVQIARDVDAPLTIIEAVIAANEARKKNLKNVVEKLLGGLKGQVIAILGLTFKANTDDMRDAASLDLVNDLVAAGATVRVYDPSKPSFAYEAFAEKVTYAAHVEEAASGAHCLVVLTEWAEFRLLDLKSLKPLMAKPNIVDFRSIFKPEQLQALGFKCYSVGKANA